MNRSPIVVCAYLVATTDMTASETIAHVKSLRRESNPCYEFREQLEKYGRQIVKTEPETFSDVQGP